MSTYADRLHATKEFYPFSNWLTYEDMEQYTEETCGQGAAIVDRLIDQLIALGEGAGEKAKLDAFQQAVEGLNVLDAENFNLLIETGEAEELCEMFNRIALAAHLDPANYAGGEGPASLWRDW